MKTKLKIIAIALFFVSFTFSTFAGEPLQKGRITFKAKEGATFTTLTNSSGTFVLDFLDFDGNGETTFERIEAIANNSSYNAEKISISLDNGNSSSESNLPNQIATKKVILCDKNSKNDCDDLNSNRIVINLSVKGKRIQGVATIEKPTKFKTVSSK